MNNKNEISNILSIVVKKTLFKKKIFVLDLKDFDKKTKNWGFFDVHFRVVSVKNRVKSKTFVSQSLRF